MKRAFLTIMLLCLFVLGIHDAQAQEYPGYFDRYWDGTQLYARQYDPYYELHEMHYKLYLPQFNPYLLYPYARLTNRMHTRIHTRLIKYIHPAAFQEDINPGCAGTDS
jgi:hypothetical protein